MEEPFIHNLNNSWLQVWTKVLTQPKEKTFVDIRDNQNLGVNNAIGWIVTSIVLGTLGRFVIFILFSGVNFSEYPPAISFAKFFFQLFIQEIFYIVARLLTLTIAQHIISRMLGGTGKYSELFLVTSTFLAPIMIILACIGAVPSIIVNIFGIPLLFFELYLHVMAVKSVYGFSWTKATLVTVAAIFVAGIILVIISIFSKLIGISINVNSPFTNAPIF